ncbi:MAG: ParA family protein [Planctomycetota bacterium]
MPIISIANQKGGVGKTTTAISLSSAFSTAGENILLIDLDPQGNASSGFGINPVREGSGAFLLYGKSEYIQTHSDRLHILPCDGIVSQLESYLASRPANHELLAKALAPLKYTYDHILIDCPPSLGILPRNALAASQEIIIPIQAEYFAMEGLAQMLGLVDEVIKLNPTLHVKGVLFTMVDPGLEHSRNVMENIRNHLKGKTFNNVIYKDVSFSESNSYGKPIFDYAPRSIGAACYRDFALEVMHG